MDEKRLSKNCLVKGHDTRGATLVDINHHIILILKKKLDVIILHVGMNDSVTRTSIEIIDDQLQLKSAITKTLPNCQVILLQPTLWVDDGKAALTIHHLNGHFLKLTLDVVNNSNIKIKQIRQKGLHLNTKGKNRFALIFMHKIKGLWWSLERLIVSTNPFIFLSKSLNKKIYMQFKDFWDSKLHKLWK